MKRAKHELSKEVMLQILSSDSVNGIGESKRDKMFFSVLRQGVAFVHTNRRITYLYIIKLTKVNNIHINLFTPTQ